MASPEDGIPDQERRDQRSLVAHEELLVDGARIDRGRRQPVQRRPQALQDADRRLFAPDHRHPSCPPKKKRPAVSAHAATRTR